MRVLIHGFPFPPSENQLRVNGMTWSKNLGRKVPRQRNSEEYLEYQMLCQAWRGKNQKALQAAGEQVRAWRLISVQAFYMLAYDRIFCTSGAPKKFDVSNRDKALHDCLVPMLGIDDREFFRVAGEKILRNRSQQDSVTLILTEVKVRNELDFYDELGIWPNHGAILTQQG